MSAELTVRRERKVHFLGDERLKTWVIMKRTQQRMHRQKQRPGITIFNSGFRQPLDSQIFVAHAKCGECKR